MALQAIGNKISKLFGKEKEIGIRIIGYSMLYYLGHDPNFYPLQTILCSSLKLSKKIAEIDRQIAEKPSKPNLQKKGVLQLPLIIQNLVSIIS